MQSLTRFSLAQIHQGMSGRIKLLRNGLVINQDNTPALGYEYDQPGEFDKQCGSFGLDPFQLPNPLCPSRFVCGSMLADRELQRFSECIDAVNW